MTVISVAAAIIYDNEQLLIARRPPGKHKSGYWEFPGGKIEPDETAEQALIRELAEELSIQANNLTPFQQVEYDYPEKRVKIQFFVVTQFSGTPQGMEGQAIQWVPLKRLNEFQFPEANVAIVNQLIARPELLFN